MMRERHVPNFLWVEGVLMAVYLTNRALTKAVSVMTPYQALNGVKPSV